MADITDFFEDVFVFSRVTVPKRLLFSFLIVLGAKIAGAIIVYSFLNIQTSGTFWFDPNRVSNLSQNAVFLRNIDIAPKWSYAFVGWDSAWYLSIMTLGYNFSPNSYAFSPGFPLFSLGFNLILGNLVVSAALCGLVFGILCIPFFQLIAESYISKQAAFVSTLLFSFSPYVFLFTTLAYSEGLFLFFTLSAWYFFKKSKIGVSSALAAISVLARFMGTLLILPMFLFSTQKKEGLRKRWIAFSLLPFAALISWFMYCQVMQNDFLAIWHTTEWGTLYSVRTLLLIGLPQKGFSAFQDIIPNGSILLTWFSAFALILAIVAPPFLIYLIAKKMDKPLALYSLVCYVWILMVGALLSIPRYISFLFPLWIPFASSLSINKKSIVLLVFASTVSFIISLILWIDFLNGQFVT